MSQRQLETHLAGSAGRLAITLIAGMLGLGMWGLMTGNSLASHANKPPFETAQRITLSR